MNDIADLSSLLMGVARTLILVAGGAIGIYKIVKGKADENPRDFNEGMVIICSAAILEAATVAVQKFFS